MANNLGPNLQFREILYASVLHSHDNVYIIFINEIN